MIINPDTHDLSRATGLTNATVAVSNAQISKQGNSQFAREKVHNFMTEAVMNQCCFEPVIFVLTQCLDERSKLHFLQYNTSRSTPSLA